MNILSYVNLIGDVKSPEVSNGGYSLDIFSPLDFSMPVKTYAKFKSSFIIDLPENLIGLLSTKAHSSNQLLITSGSVIYPGYKNELQIEIQNVGSGLIEIRKDDPLLQITFLQGTKLA